MKLARIHGPGDIRIDDVDEPQLGPRDVIIAMRACGVCGSDVTYLAVGGVPGRDDQACPMPVGHEPAGEVIAVGDEVVGITPGMRVVFDPTGDMTNVIGNGGTEGALGDRVVVHEAVLGRTVLHIPDGVPYEVAALSEPLAVSLHAVNRADPQPHESVVVFGAGPVGVGIVAWCKLRGVRDVVSVDLSVERLALASAMGADATIVATDDVVAKLTERHGAETLLGSPVTGTDVWIDAAGAQAVIDNVMAGAKKNSRFVLVAVHHRAVTIELVRFLPKEMTFTSSIAYPVELADVVASMGEHWQLFAPMITDRVPFENVGEAIALAGAPGTRGKVMIHLSGGEE